MAASIRFAFDVLENGPKAKTLVHYAGRNFCRLGHWKESILLLLPLLLHQGAELPLRLCSREEFFTFPSSWISLFAIITIQIPPCLSTTPLTCPILGSTSLFLLSLFLIDFYTFFIISYQNASFPSKISTKVYKNQFYSLFLVFFFNRFDKLLVNIMK